MEDIVPSLYPQIEDDFLNRIHSDQSIQTLVSKAEKGNGTTDEISLYARALGKHASEALSKGLQSKNLPDGKIYWNIAERTIKPLFHLVYDMVNVIADMIQKSADKKNNISIKPIKAEFPTERIEAIENKIVYESLNGDASNE